MEEEILLEVNNEQWFWLNEPPSYQFIDGSVHLKTVPATDFWQRTYYGFRNDNASALQIQTKETYFSFTVKVKFDTQKRFDQAGILLYLDSENWLKASSEYKNELVQRLGSVVTNNGYSDWATSDIPATINTIWYRLSRREADYRLDYSLDGESFSQMRICHLFKGDQEIAFGIYACSPEDSSFDAVFSDFELTECLWKEHV